MGKVHLVYAFVPIAFEKTKGVGGGMASSHLTLSSLYFILRATM